MESLTVRRLDVSAYTDINAASNLSLNTYDTLDAAYDQNSGISSNSLKIQSETEDRIAAEDAKQSSEIAEYEADLQREGRRQAATINIKGAVAKGQAVLEVKKLDTEMSVNAARDSAQYEMELMRIDEANRSDLQSEQSSRDEAHKLRLNHETREQMEDDFVKCGSAAEPTKAALVTISGEWASLLFIGAEEALASGQGHRECLEEVMEYYEYIMDPYNGDVDAVYALEDLSESYPSWVASKTKKSRKPISEDDYDMDRDSPPMNNFIESLRRFDGYMQELGTNGYGRTNYIGGRRPKTTPVPQLNPFRNVQPSGPSWGQTSRRGGLRGSYYW